MTTQAEVDIDYWLRRQSDRCDICGCHPATQGRSKQAHYEDEGLCTVCNQHLVRPVDQFLNLGGCPTGLHAIEERRQCKRERKPELPNKITIDGVTKFIAYLRDLAEKPRLVGKRNDMIKTDNPHVIQILYQACGDLKENDSWKCYVYTDEEGGHSWPLCDDCVRGESPHPLFIWSAAVPGEAS